MIKNHKMIEEFERRFELEYPKTYMEKLAIFEDMLRTVNSLKRRENILSGLDEKIEIIKRLHNAK